jgi:hypothetical protein
LSSPPCFLTTTSTPGGLAAAPLLLVLLQRARVEEAHLQALARADEGRAGPPGPHRGHRPAGQGALILLPLLSRRAVSKGGQARAHERGEAGDVGPRRCGHAHLERARAQAPGRGLASRGRPPLSRGGQLLDRLVVGALQRAAHRDGLYGRGVGAAAQSLPRRALELGDAKGDRAHEQRLCGGQQGESHYLWPVGMGPDRRRIRAEVDSWRCERRCRAANAATAGQGGQRRRGCWGGVTQVLVGWVLVAEALQRRQRR